MSNKLCTGYLCFLVVVKFLGIAIPQSDAEKFIDCSSNDEIEKNILLVSKKMHMKSRVGKVNYNKLKSITTPVIAKKKDDEYILLLSYMEGTWTVLDPLKKTPEKMSDDKIKNLITGHVLVFGKKNSLHNTDTTKFGFRWFIPTILKFKKQFICVLIAVFTVQIIGILTPLMTQVVVDKVLAHHALSTLTTIAIGITIAYIYELLISLSKNYLFTHTTNRIDVILSSRLFHHLFSLPLRYFESRRVGETVARVRELDTIRSFLTGTPLSSFIDFVFIIVYIVVLYFYSIPLAVIVTASVPVFAILSLIVTPLFKKSLDRKFETGANAQSFLVESITGIQTVKSFALENKFEDKWGDLQSEYVKAGYKTSMISSTSGSVATFIQRITDLIILVMGAGFVIDGRMTIGQLVAFRMLANRVSGPVLRLVQLWQEYQQASLSVQRIGDIFRSPMERLSNNTISNLPTLKGRIEFEKVWFRYSADAGDVLKDISFEIPEGKIVGLVGRSGSGKSTISKLIQRLYLPQNGKITIDGMDISVMDPTYLRNQIGVVLQENFMFNGKVAENISIHCKTKTMDEIISAAKIAGAHDFIMELKEGYDTIIGEKGVQLSGGQKQRVAIARAIIHDPRILIFDEATSALDYESEAIIHGNMKQICKGRTVLIIAHRLSTLRIADEIMVMDKGIIAEKGSHEELMSHKGLYAHLYEMQLRGEKDE